MYYIDIRLTRLKYEHIIKLLRTTWQHAKCMLKLQWNMK